MSITGNSVSENSVHRKVIHEFVHIPRPLRIGLPLHIGFSRMSSGADWVSEKFRTPEAQFPRRPLLGNLPLYQTTHLVQTVHARLIRFPKSNEGVFVFQPAGDG